MKKGVIAANSSNKHSLMKSGIPGLDKVMGGGIRRNSSIVLSGCPGSGKTMFALQFLIDGAKNGEPSVYITTEETAESIEDYGKTLGFNVDELKKKGLLYIVEQRPGKGRLMTIEAPMKLIFEKKIKRVVLDSLTLFEYVFSNTIGEYRKGVLQFLADMKESGVTLLATSGRAFEHVDNTQYKPEDSLFEGVINLLKVRKGSVFERVITIEKMRGQSHLLGLYPFKITDEGIEVFPDEIPFTLVEDRNDSFKK